MMINNNIKNILIGLIFIMCYTQALAHINPNRRGQKPSNATQLETRVRDCTQATAQVDQNINNVRARLTTGGDVWWDPNSQMGRYIVPAVPVGSGLDEVSSIFAAAVWLGGFDPEDNLKMAATDYRMNGSTDFYPGPIDELTGTTGLDTCQQWDRFFEVQGDDVDQAIRDWESLTANGEPYDLDDIPDGVKFWPGNDNPYFRDRFPFELPSTSAGLGAYWDEDFNGIYDPVQGDFPIIEIRGCEPFDRNSAKELVPDEMIFWIYNDAGNGHTLTRGDAINMEVQVQSFAYATNDEINDMTFQRYKLINRASTDIRQTYFGWWTDPDLGCSEDDYSGTDVSRSLAYTYNEDILDGRTGTCDCGAAATYCDEIPMIGTDYFRGPLGPKNIVPCPSGEQHIIGIADEGYDDDVYSIGDTICIVDVDPLDLSEPDIKVELGMSSFIYYNRTGLGNPEPQTVDPNGAEAYYNYLTGRWNDGTPLTRGGTGFNPGSTDVTLFAFPDPPNMDGGDSMAEEALPLGDRRTVQSSGPFLLKPGDRNELIIGAVWVPNVVHPRPSLAKLQAADDVAQNLFDACFDIVDGPDAPDVCTIELDKEIIIVLTNDTIESNNAFEAYTEVDILSSLNVPDSLRMFEFEGYQVYQLVNQTVSPQELDDVERAMLVAQVDVENGVTEIYNWEGNANPVTTTEILYTPTRKVDGADTGIEHTFSLTTDAFSTDVGGLLVNHKTYYYMAVAYAYNNFATFDVNNPAETQQNPYLEGRGNISVYSATPRPIVYQGLNAQYGDGVPITRLAGIGVGENVVDLNESMYATILNGEFNGDILYDEGAGPIEVKIYNPLEVKDGTFQLELQGTFADGSQCGLNPGVTWVLTDVTNNVEIASEQTIDALNEQIITQYGFSVAIGQSQEPGQTTKANNGALAALLDYEDPTGSNWFRGIRDDDTSFDDDGLGQVSLAFDFLQTDVMQAQNELDPNQSYSNLGDGYWYPFHLASGRQTNAVNDLAGFFLTPGWKITNLQNALNSELRDLNNVDIIFTSDKTLWSECIVVETATDDYIAQGTPIGEASMLDLRGTPSIDMDGNPLNDGTVGKSFFPGYAIDVETGKRLNIFFGENSLFEQGQDLIYNPTDDFDQVARDFGPLSLVMGGHHYIYVTRQEYDGCDDLANRINSNLSNKVDALESITWTSMSLLQDGQEMLSLDQGLVPNDLTIKLRVANPYNLETSFNLNTPTACLPVNEEDFPLYEFDIVGREAVDLTQEASNSILDSINVVPNPYYAYSSYETSSFDKAVKITNLPDAATVTIYSLDGKFIQEFRRDEMPSTKTGANPGITNSQTNPDIRWNLENYAGIPVASGVYLIHISALGEERTIKWFGVNRKFDASGL